MSVANKNEEDGERTDGPIADIIKGIFNYNRYATKKTITQGFLDLALLASNVNHLKQVMDREKDEIYYTMISLISISIILQVVAGAIIIYVGALTLKKKETADRLNDVVTGLLFLVSVVNVIISGIGVFREDTKIKLT